MGETVAVQSEISMSIVTGQWRAVQAQQRPVWRWPWRSGEHSPPPYHLLEQSQSSSRARHFFPKAIVNVEPVIFLSSMAFALYYTIYPPFLFWARCVEMFHTFDLTGNNSTNATEFCQRIAMIKDRRALEMVEADVAKNSIYLQIFSSLPSLLTAPIFGAWSDYHGRRPPYLLSQFGLFFYLVLSTLSSFIYPSTNIYYFLAPAEMSFGLFSGMMGYTLAGTIVVDECRDKLAESRSGIPQRIAIASAVQFLGLFTGNLISTLFVSLDNGPNHAESYSRAFVLAAAISAVGIVYTYFCVRETHFPSETDNDQHHFSTHLRHYTLDAIGVMTKKREGWTRLCIFLTISFMFVDFMSSDSSLLYLLLKQYNWTDAEFTNLTLVRVLLNSAGTIIIPLLIRRLNWPGAESLLLMAAIAAFGINCGLFAFARTVPQIYALSLFSLVTACISPCFRTILARFVSKVETGRLFAFATIMMSICPLISKLVMNSFYWATMEIWPGMVFLFMAILHIFVLFGQITVHKLMLPIWSSSPQVLDEADQSEGTSSSSESSGSGLGDSDRSMVGSTTGEE